MYIVKNLARVHMAKDARACECASPPYERVPNISQYTFNNLFIIYLLHLSSGFIRTVYIRNQNIISACQPKKCFKFKITLCHLVSSYIFKTTPNRAKVKMTFSIRCDVSKQTLTLTRTRRHFPVLLFCVS